jgi:Leucine-rich repeat (LRR) protein
MYDYEFNKQTSDIAWNEVVDLVRFIAADNEIESIPNEAFPDTDQNTLGPDDDVKGPQFGGIELLDLHGNILSNVPIGLRRLERLTTLNLVSNAILRSSNRLTFKVAQPSYE